MHRRRRLRVRRPAIRSTDRWMQHRNRRDRSTPTAPITTMTKEEEDEEEEEEEEVEGEGEGKSFSQSLEKVNFRRQPFIRSPFFSAPPPTETFRLRPSCYSPSVLARWLF